jgi:LPXTG-motif cell wall-anchored protein
MTSRNVGLLTTGTVLCTFLVLIVTTAPVVAQAGQNVTICEATGSATNPWVFTTIDARDLDEHLARGDFRATSISDCPTAKVSTTPPPSARLAATQPATPSPTVTGKPSPTAGIPRSAAATPGATAAAVQQQSVTGSVPDVSVSKLAGSITNAQATSQAVATPTPPGLSERATPPASNSVSVAGAQATPASVSTLPKSGGEPDRTILVLGLMLLIGAGLGLRRLARAP